MALDLKTSSSKIGDMTPSFLQGKDNVGAQYLQSMQSAKDEEKRLAAESGKWEGQQAQFKSQNEAELAQATALASQKEADQIRNNPARAQLQEVDKELMTKEFVPTKETAKDLATLFSLINVIGFAIGAGGKGHAQAAMSAMNGMLEGHQKGRDDLYKKEKDIFETSMKTLKNKSELLHNRLKEDMEIYTKDREAGINNARAHIAEAGATFIGQNLDKYGLPAAFKLAGETVADVGKAFELVQKDKDKVEQRAFDLKKIEMEHQNRLKELQAKSSLKQDDVVAELDSLGVHISDKKDRATVSNSVGSMAELKALKNEVINNPSLVGRQGQIAQFTQRYINSFKTGEPIDETKVTQADQAALLFAKKYASMLTRYELALAGTSRGGSTVSFQARYNNLLSQNQFNAASLVQLFDDMQIEVARGAMEKSNKLTYGMMDDMSNKLISNLPSEVGGGSPSPAPSQDIQSAAIKNFNKYEPEKYSYGFENGRFYREAK